VGGKLCLLIGVRTLPLLKCRHNIPPFFRRESDGYKAPSKYTSDFLQVLYKNKTATGPFCDVFKKNSPDSM
jgi:hypothetical protein